MAQLVAPRLGLFGLGNGLAPPLIERKKITQQGIGIGAAGAQFCLDEFKIGADKLQIEHDLSVYSAGRGLLSPSAVCSPRREDLDLRQMPTIFRERGFRFFFYSNEGAPRERAHVHVEKDNMEAKFWLRPEILLAYNDGCDARTLRQLLAIIEANRERIERAWNEYFG